MIYTPSISIFKSLKEVEGWGGVVSRSKRVKKSKERVKKVNKRLFLQ